MPLSNNEFAFTLLILHMYFDGYSHPHLWRVAYLSLVLLCEGTLLWITTDIITYSTQSLPGFDKSYEAVSTLSDFFTIFAPMIAPSLIRKKSLRFTLWFSTTGCTLFCLFSVILSYCAEKADTCNIAGLTVGAVILTIFSNFAHCLLLISVVAYGMRTSPPEERGNFLGVILGIEGLTAVGNASLIYLLRSMKGQEWIISIFFTIISLINTMTVYNFPDPQKIESKKAVQDILEHSNSIGSILTILKKLIRISNFKKLFALMAFTGALVAVYEGKFDYQLCTHNLVLGTESPGYLFVLGGFAAFGAFLNGYLIDLNSKIVSFKIGFSVFTVAIVIGIVNYFLNISILNYIELAIYGYSDTAGELIVLAFIAHEFAAKLEGICFQQMLHQSTYFVFTLITKYWGQYLPITIILWVFGAVALHYVTKFDLMAIFEDEYFKNHTILPDSQDSDILGGYFKNKNRSLNSESDFGSRIEKPLIGSVQTAV